MRSGKWLLAATMILVAATSALAGGGPPPTPEINPGLAASAVALIAGSIAVLSSRRKAK